MGEVVKEYNKTHEDLKANMNKLREQLMTNQHKKTDTRDYQFNKVYTWPEEWRRNRRVQIGKSIYFKDVTCLCTYDVKSLSMNIPLQEGMEAVITKLKDNAMISNRNISFLMSLLDTILTKNYFKFGAEHYLQIQGTSMGSPVAPGYANVFMDNIKSCRILPSHYGVHVKAWYCFVDDIFVL